jgi:Flp pilus assembly pilin Flp
MTAPVALLAENPGSREHEMMNCRRSDRRRGPASSAAEFTLPQHLRQIIARITRLRRDRMQVVLERLLRSESGATAIEYAFIGVLISIAVVTAVVQIGTSVSGMFQQISNGF